VNGDTLVEPDQTFFVDLSGATNGATIATATGIGTILNDDTGPKLPSAPGQVHANDLTYAGTASGSNHFIDILNFEASCPDLIRAYGTDQQSAQNWYNTFEPREARVETFDGLDYVASYNDLINAYASAGSLRAVQDAGATHFILNGSTEGRTTTFNGLDTSPAITISLLPTVPIATQAPITTSSSAAERDERRRSTGWITSPAIAI
jgi:hypothetical protein